MWITFIIAIVAVVLDQVVKLIFEYNVSENQTITVIKNFLSFTKTYNTGAGWSMFADNTVFLTVLSLVASIAIGYIIYLKVKKFNEKKVFSIGIGLVLGGTVGNLIDRFLTSIGSRDGVVDFIKVDFPFYHDYPIFNLADSFLVVGVVLILIDVLFFMEKRDKVKISNEENEEIDNEQKGI